MSTTWSLPYHSLSPDRPPAVLLGGVNLVRTLGLAGIPAIVASPDRYEPALASRYCVGGGVLPPFDSGEPAVDALVDLGSRLSERLGRRVPLVYGSDDALAFIYAHQARLERYFIFLVNEPRIANGLLTKDRFQELAAECGLPVPRALTWGDGPDSVARRQGPVLVKPREKSDWHHSALCQRLFGGDGKALIFESGAAAAAHAEVAHFHESLIFQEYIPGGDGDHWSFHGMADEHGEVLASFVGRKIRTYPTTVGESAFIELARDEGLAAIGRDIARRCPIKGVFKMDFKRDPGTGKWYLLEVNARYTLWHYLAACNGLNLIGTAYDYLVHGRRPVTEPDYLTRFRWISLPLDFKAFREMRGRGEITTLGWLRSIVFSRNVGNVIALNDLGPWIRLWKGRFGRRAERAAARLAIALRPWLPTAS